MPEPGEMPDVVIEKHGTVTPVDHAYAERKISALTKFAPGPILFVKVHLVMHADPARSKRATAKGEIDLNGRLVVAHAEATTMPAAIDELESRLGAQLKRLYPESPRQRAHR